MKYIILSLNHGTGSSPCFWRANNAGYTEFPFAAGHYSEEQLKAHPDYYNNGISTLAIPLTEQGLNRLGFKCTYDDAQTVHFLQKQKT